MLTEILLPGQSRYLHFYEDRFVELGEYSIANGAIVALGFFNGVDGSLLSTCTLAEIDEYNRLDLGVGLTLRGVSRVDIVNVTSVRPFIKVKVVKCIDSNDDDDESDAILSTGGLQAITLEELEEKIYEAHEVLEKKGLEADIAVDSSPEIKVDPRALLEPGGRLRVDKGKLMSKGDPEPPRAPSESDTPLRFKVRVARATQVLAVCLKPRRVV
jgi:hypothetical protein